MDARERDAASGRSGSRASYRGFLFADVRGYTELIERHGNAAASQLLENFRQLVQGQ